MEMKNSQKCTQENYSNDVVRCTNSQAISNGHYTLETPTIECGFCNKKLEQTGYYIKGNSLFAKWRTIGRYERCSCKESIIYWEKFDKEEAEKKAEEIRLEAEKLCRENLEKLMKYSNLGERFKTRTFETFIQNKENHNAYEVCKDYSENFKKLQNKGIGLLITGSYGAGKTHLAAAITHSLIKQNIHVVFGTLITLLGKVKASYGDYAKENEDTIINKYLNCNLLIIDDLGKEKPTEWIMEKLYYIINCRYENNKPIVITSNYSDTKLIDRLTIKEDSGTAEAIVSRLFEICQGVDMNKCKDYRRL